MDNTANLTQLDPHQIARYTYDEALNANRVYIVNGGPAFANYSPGLTKVPEPIIVEREKLVQVEVPTIITQVQYREIEKPVYIDRVVEVIKEVAVEKIVYKEIQVPVVTEKVVMVKESSVQGRDYIKILLSLQTVAMFALLVVKLFK